MRSTVLPLLSLIGLLLVGPARSFAEDAPAAPPPAEGPKAPAIDEKDRYAGTPDEFLPHRHAGPIPRRLFLEPPTFRGPGAELPEPAGVAKVRLGAILPLSGIDKPVGDRILNGYTLAVEEFNAEGGFRPGVPIELVTRDENDAWGAAGNALVDLVSHENCWAVFGALDDSNSHVMTRVLLKIEVCMINTNGTDPTLTEHQIPWLIRLRPDDRQSAYRIAKKVLFEDNRQRVVVFRANDRYARQGIGHFNAACRRVQRPIALEVRFPNEESDLRRQVEAVKEAKPDAVVMWGRAIPTGRALAAMRAAGVDAPVYMSDRCIDADFLKAAGAAAEGVILNSPFAHDGSRPQWVEFRRKYRARFGSEPDHQAAFAYDGMRYGIECLRASGLNKARHREELYRHPTYEGVGQTIRWDATHNNVAPEILVTVKDGAFVFGDK